MLFVSSYYWSSTENNATNAWNQNFGNGNQNNNNNKNNNRYVRAVRKLTMNYFLIIHLYSSLTTNPSI